MTWEAAAAVDKAAKPKAALRGIPMGWSWTAPDYDSVWREREARLKALRAEPSRLPGILDFYKEHPVEFICDWGITVDPRNANTGLPTTMPFLLFERQQEFIDWMLERWHKREDGVIEKSRDMGITWCCVAFAVWMWRFWSGAVIGFGSRDEDSVDRLGDPDSIFWKIREYIGGLPSEFKPRGFDMQRHSPFMRCINVPGEAVIKGEAGDNIGRGGRASLYIKDESAHWKHPEQADLALSQTANVQIDVSTPNGEGNPFWLKTHSGKIPKFVFDWREDPRKGQAWYDDQVSKKTKVAVAQEIDRDYSASIMNSFIEGDIVTAAMHRGAADVRAIGGLRVGLDVARFGDDSCVLSFRRGRVLLKQVKWGKTDIASTAGRALREIRAFKELPDQVAVDVVGVGAGAADLLRGYFNEMDDLKVGGKPQGWRVVDVNAGLVLDNGKHFNLRALMWDQMKDWLPTASIPNDQGLRVALTATRYKYQGGELLLESKDEMKRRGVKSPDEGDSLALTFAIPVTVAPSEPIFAHQVAAYPIDSEMGM